MKLKNPVLSLVAASLTVLLALQSAWAIQVSGERPSGKVSTSSPLPFAEPRGTIDRIDLGSNTMVVDGVAYLFTGTSVIVHSTDPSVAGNPLKLSKGNRIRFTIKKEATANKGRMTEIWVIEDKPLTPQAK